MDKNMNKLSVHLVTWNGAKYVPFLFESLRKQTYKDWTLFVLDNNSDDNTVELIKKELSNFSIQSKVVEDKTNLGFAGGHNQAFKESDAEYILLLNQDMFLAPDCLEKVVRFLDQHPEAASVSPRLMKWNFPTNFTDQIDALGLKVYRSRRVVEQYTQQNWQELKKKFSSAILPVFGVSGALPVFRTFALKSIAYEDGSIFDESYHSYKEDVDLAFRLATAGYKSYVVLDAVAYHDRSAAGPKQADDAHALANKQKQSEWVKYHSYKNHLATLYKNEYWQNFTLDFPWILWYELKKFVYFLLFDRRVLGGLKELLGQDLAKKRRLIKSLQKISWQEMRKWWRS
ncbi:MAG: family 2 glycosyl transferase [Candidatus Magasanikbacteria bacterium GW2011_GWA2_40_10]|uniref:Family 2 glycosyl transferase n=1 Tax=Candidatus Magasanikbacteria bacterium GW2011_GWA2_40_10 TaxID=1619037 RepID=A0A0G0QDW7_9BACT|nr:MAG: family 2 glycosyl transferase [Candidatus Magasanikbacteria bacterium GW2011_GWA2_40_10]